MKYSEDRTFTWSGKFIPEKDYSLAGRSFTFAMDDGEEYVFNFLSGETLMWARMGEAFRAERYGCLESDENTYFVHFEVLGEPFRTGITMVIDVENSLVTMCTATLGALPNRPRIVENRFVFGAIRVDGQPLPVKRHGFTDELVGKQITWHYADGFINTHIYTSERYYRIFTVREANGNTNPDNSILFEEPTTYVKIKDGFYLCSFIEINLNKRDPMRGGNNLMILINTKKGFDVGRTFTKNSQQQFESGMFLAYGEFSDEKLDCANAVSPYRV